MTTNTPRHGNLPRTSRVFGKRWVPVAAAATAAVLTAGAIATAGGGAAGAATAPHAQSAGNFLDATIGGNPIDQIAKLAFARAQNPGSVTDQNPLDVTALNAINLPLTGALQLPELLGVKLGAVNQVASAKADGSSYGAAGAVLNSGGVSVGGNNSAPPADATIDLTAAGLAGNSPLPIPGGSGSAAALGGVTARIGAVSSIARTPKYGPALANSWLDTCSQSDPTCYNIASLKLTLGSPLLGGVLTQLTTTLTTTLNGVLGQLTTAVGGITGGSAALDTCVLTSPTVIAQPITLAGGGVVIDPSNASLTIDVEALLKSLKLDLNDLPANTDLLAKVIDYLTSPDGLAAGLESVIGSVTGLLTSQFTGCKALVNSIPILGPVLTTLVGDLTAGQQQVTALVNGVVDDLANAAGGSSPLAPIGTLLGKLLAVGVNVQPQVNSGDFKTNLDALPKQGMTAPPVPYAHTVRALEVQVLGGAVTLALANSAAGPSNPAPAASSAPPSTPAPSTAVPATNIPTGVPAGMGTTHGGSPVLPITLLGLAVLFAAGGVAAYRFRGRLNTH
jgi:hypothetical protein